MKPNNNNNWKKIFKFNSNDKEDCIWNLLLFLNELKNNNLLNNINLDAETLYACDYNKILILEELFKLTTNNQDLNKFIKHENEIESEKPLLVRKYSINDKTRKNDNDRTKSQRIIKVKEKNIYYNEIKRNLSNKTIKNDNSLIKKFDYYNKKIDYKNNNKDILNWLIENDILLKNSTKYFNKIPKITKSGVLFKDIINKFERKDVITGFIKEPKTYTEYMFNYSKIKKFLENYENFNNKLINNDLFDKIIMNNDIFYWKFLKIIKNFYCKNKILIKRKKSIILKEKIEITDIEYNDIKGKKDDINIFNTTKNQNQNNSFFSNIENEKILEKELNQLDKKILNLKENININEFQSFKDTTNDNSFKSNYTTVNKKKKKENLFILNNSDISVKNDKIDYKNYDQKENIFKSIIKELNLNKFILDYKNKKFFKDNIRNGFLINILLNYLLGIKINHICSIPNVINEIYNNYNKALSILNERCPNIHEKYKNQILSIIKGNYVIFYDLIKEIYDFSKSIDKTNKKYDFKENKKIYLFFEEIGLSYKYNDSCNYEFLIEDAKSGILFYNILKNGFNHFIKGFFMKPTNEINKKSNLDKIFNYLMNLKYFDCTYISYINQIYNGNEKKIIIFLKYLIDFFNKEYKDKFLDLKYNYDHGVIDNKDINLETLNNIIEKNKDTLSDLELKKIFTFEKEEIEKKNTFINKKLFQTEEIKDDYIDENKIKFFLKNIGFGELNELINWDKPYWEEFSNCLLFFKILEYIKQDNFEKYYKNLKSHKSSNIKNFFKLLKLNYPNSDIDIFNKETEIYKGERKIIYKIIENFIIQFK